MNGKYNVSLNRGKENPEVVDPLKNDLQREWIMMKYLQVFTDADNFWRLNTLADEEAETNTYNLNRITGTAGGKIKQMISTIAQRIGGDESID